MATNNQINHFLLIYDREQGKQIALEEFGPDSDRAVLRYQEVEREHADNKRMDIVLVGSDSVETVRITHANYFDNSRKTVDAALRDFSSRYATPDIAKRMQALAAKHAKLSEAGARQTVAMKFGR